MSVRTVTSAALKVSAFIAAVLFVAEALLFLQEKIFLDKDGAELAAYLRKENGRIDLQWIRTGPQPDPFSPPLTVFSNKDSGDPERLRMIFQATRLPPGTTWHSFDFLQPEESASTTAYTVTSNSLGFRGREYRKEKDPGTYRVIALGSYHTFGHGVEDDETYSAQLEGLLRAKMGRNVEVWNGGRHAASAIVGLARMENEVLEYDPDLLILEYGFVDTLVIGDNFFPIAMRFPDSPLALAMRTLMTPLLSAVSDMRVWSRAGGQLLKKYEPQRLEQFRETMERIIARAQEHGIPVVIVRTRLTLAPYIYRQFEDENAFFVDVEDALKKTVRYPSPQEVENNPYWKRTWLVHLQPSAALQEQFPLYPYQLNRFQWNSRGQRAVAEVLASFIREEVLPTTKP